MQQQRPWHSIIRLPPQVSSRGHDKGDAPRTQDAEPVEIRNYAVDVLIILIRVLLSVGFYVGPEDRQSPLIVCANHNFGWDPTPDFEAKGMLLAALYPDWDAERFKSEHISLSALLGHEEVRKVIFGSMLFWLVHPQELIFDDRWPEVVTGVRELSRDEIVAKSEVVWDGRRPLSTSLVESIFPDSRKPQGKPAVYSALPDFIRVRLRPSAIADHTSFERLIRLHVELPIVVAGPDGSNTNDWARPIYTLRAIVRFARDEANSASEPDIRLYDIEGDPITITKRCDLSCEALADKKLKPYRKWVVGEPDFQYLLAYSRIDGPRNPSPPPPRGTVGEMLPEEELGPHISTKYIKVPAHQAPRSLSSQLLQSSNFHFGTAIGRIKSLIDDKAKGFSVALREALLSERDTTNIYKAPTQRSARHLQLSLCYTLWVKEVIDAGPCPWADEFYKTPVTAELNSKSVDTFKLYRAWDLALDAPDRALEIIANIEEEDAPPVSREQPATGRTRRGAAVSDNEEGSRKESEETEADQGAERVLGNMSSARDDNNNQPPAIQMAVAACRGPRNTTYLLTGPPSSGKSIAFPAALAREKSTFVICVQMSERTARSRAAYASSTVAAGGGPSIACLGDREAISGTRPAHALTYVSYKWLERMATNFPALAAIQTPVGHPMDHPMDYSAPRDGWLLFFVLDDIHAQTMGQELGYLALYRVRRAAEDNYCRRLPLRVVLATSYPHPDTLRHRFGTKDSAWAADATVSLRDGGGGDPRGADDSRFTYLPHRVDEWASPAMFVASCKLKIAEILGADPAARILLFVMSDDQAGQVSADLPEGLRGKWSVATDGADFSNIESGPGPWLIIRTFNFAAAAPLCRVGHIICTHSVRTRIFDNNHGQAVERSVPLRRDEQQFMRDHSSGSRPRVHHMFSEKVARDAREGGGALFMDGDCLEYWFRALRVLGPEAFTQKSLLRLHPAIQRTQWALMRLRLLGLIGWGDGPVPGWEALLTRKGAAALEAADKFELGIRVAAFLEEVALDLAEGVEGASEAESRDALLLAIVMAAAAPGLVHRAAGRTGLGDDVLAELDIRGLTEIGEGAWYGGDHWVDAAYWLSAIRPERRRRAAPAGVPESFVKKRDDFVSDIRHFHAQGQVIQPVDTMFYRWMEAFRHGLIYVDANDVFAGRREGILISTGKRVGIHPAVLLRLDRLAESARSAKERGFYLVVSVLERNRGSPGEADAKRILSLPVKLVAEFEDGKPGSTLRERVAYIYNKPW
ncbi:hypothetical protein DL765_004173 [Monosporascus sp. GIB2]|nr:hypothetical protein DL765_004173 [Monosporascus sp. GIB2]